MGACKGKPMQLGVETFNQSCLDMFARKPDFKRYKGDPQALKNAEQLHQSNTFGGSVLSSVGRVEKGVTGKRDIKNALEQELKDFNVSFMQGGNFYEIMRVNFAAHIYCDIWMLISAIDDVKFQHTFNVANCQEEKKDSLKMEKFQKYMNGYGRIIFYTVEGNEPNKPEKCSIVKIYEGRFKQGERDGYNRAFMAGSKDPFCELGFFAEDNPAGKYQKFKLNGEIIEEGLKEKTEMTKAYKVSSYLTRTIKTSKTTKDDVGRATISAKASKGAKGFEGQNKIMTKAL